MVVNELREWKTRNPLSIVQMFSRCFINLVGGFRAYNKLDIYMHTPLGVL